MLTLSLSRPPNSSLPLSSSNSIFFNKPTFTTTSNLLVLRKNRTVERARKGLSCNALFGLGVPELVVIAGVAALVFGPKKLPEVGKSIGKTVKSFQQAAKEFESELKRDPESLPDSSGEAAPTPVKEEKKQETEVPSSKESV